MMQSLFQFDASMQCVWDDVSRVVQPSEGLFADSPVRQQKDSAVRSQISIRCQSNHVDIFLTKRETETRATYPYEMYICIYEYMYMSRYVYMQAYINVYVT